MEGSDGRGHRSRVVAMKGDGGGGQWRRWVVVVECGVVGGQGPQKAAEGSREGFAGVEGQRRRQRRGSDVESDVITYRNRVRRGRDVLLEQK